MDKNDQMAWLHRIAPCPRPIPAGGFPEYSGQVVVRPHWTAPKRVIYDHELLLFLQGDCAMELEGEEYSCQSGSYFIVPPGRLHRTWEKNGRSARVAWMHFDWIWQGPTSATPTETFFPTPGEARFYRPAPDFVPRTVFHGAIGKPAQARELIERLIAVQRHQGEHGRLRARALSLELLVELLHPVEAETSSTQGTGLAEQVREILEHSLEEGGNRRIESLLGKLGYSYAHLSRVFHRRYGLPPLRYLHAFRMSHAQRMLRDLDCSVSEVAKRLGYSDPLHFSRLFRRLVGKPPSHFARDFR